MPKHATQLPERGRLAVTFSEDVRAAVNDYHRDHRTGALSDTINYLVRLGLKQVAARPLAEKLND